MTFSDIILDKKLYKENNENILIYDISHKTSTDAQPFRIRFDEIDGFIKIYNKIRCSLLFDEWCDKINDRIKFLLKEKSGVTFSINHNFAIIRTGSYNYLAIEKILTFDNVIIVIKSIVNKYKNAYSYNIFLENGWYKDKSTAGYF